MKQRPREVLRAVCHREGDAHTLLRVEAAADGYTLVVPHPAVATAARPIDEAAVFRDPADVTISRVRGTEYRLPLTADAPSFECCCACGVDYFVNPAELRRAIAAGRRRVVLAPTI